MDGIIQCMVLCDGLLSLQMFQGSSVVRTIGVYGLMISQRLALPRFIYPLQEW